MSVLEIASGIVLILLCAIIVALTLFTKSDGGGLNALSGKCGSAYSAQDNNAALTKLIRNAVIIMVIICFALNIISAHSI